MDIVFKSNKLEKACNDRRKMVKEWGQDNAREMQKRLADFEAADCLEDISHLPPIRRHELKGDRRGELAVNLKHPFRLVFEPAHDPVPRLEDGSLDLTRITRIRILEVVNYHDD